MKSRWIRIAKYLIVFFLIVLFFNAYSLFVEIKRDIHYNNRAYGLTTMDDSFENGEYYQIYIDTVKNAIADENPGVDTSQYEAFGRLYEAYLNARMYEDNDVYVKQMENEKKNITWKKILTVVETLENDIRHN